MKILITFLITLNCFANGFVSKQEVESKSISKTFLKKDQCESVMGSPCLKLPKEKFHMAYLKIEPEKNLKEQSTSCSNESDCQEKFLGLNCESEGFRKIKNLDSMEVYCTKFIPKNIAIDESLKASHEADQLAKEQERAQIESVKKKMRQGEDVLALIAIRNVSKGLSTGQIKQMSNLYSGIRGLLQTGSLETAKEEIQAISPDGVLVTQEDKDAILAKINEFLSP